MKSSAHPSVKETNMTFLEAPKRALGGIRVGLSPLMRTVVVVLLSMMALLGGQVAAQAHDSLESTLPVDGSVVESMPAQIALTMSNTPAAIGAQIQVLDQAGADWSQGKVEVLDNVATQAVKGGAPAGKYTVKWRLVSSDSHPIESQFTFTTKTAAAGSAGGAVAGPAQSINAVSEQATPNAPVTGGVPWSIYGLIAILVVVVIAMVVVTRRRVTAADKS